MSDEKENNPRLGRRLLVTRAASGAGLAALAGGTAAAQSGRSDSDPSDRPGYGRSGRTDSDPRDQAGRGGARAAPRGRTGLTDADPADGAGNGRGAGAGRTRTGLTDSDPSDGAGYGRRGR